MHCPTKIAQILSSLSWLFCLKIVTVKREINYTQNHFKKWIIKAITEILQNRTSLA